ncbi:TonB-dependent receptor [bacterium]|nr:TonB-dependent receptor [bacterium]
MTKFVSIIICMTVYLPFISENPCAQAQNSLHAVTGTVRRPDNTPVPVAVVKLSPGVYADTTDAAGRFEIRPVPRGEYVLSVSAPYSGFDDVVKTVTVPGDASEPLNIMMTGKAYRLDEIVVLGTQKAVPAEPEKASSFVTVVERSEFENKATTVADVIRATPSASISSMGGLGDYSEVSLRGSYSNQVQVYIDGMLLNEAVGGAVNLGTLPLTNVESVEVWRSGAPVQFGGDAVGGVINIKTRSAHTAQKTFSAGYGSFNTFTADTVFSIPHERSRFLVTLDYASSDNDFKYMSDNGTMYNSEDDYRARRFNDQFRSSNLLAKYSHILCDGVIFEFSDHVLSNHKNLPGNDNIRYSYASLETTKNLFQANLTVKPLFRDYLQVKPSFHHIYNYEHYSDENGSVGWGYQDNVYKTNTYSFILPFTVHLSDIAAFNLTPTAKHESYRPENRLQQTLPLSCDREQYALVSDIMVRIPGERLVFTASLRRDRYFSSYEGQPSPQNRITPKSKFNHVTNSHTGINFRVWRGLSVKANYGDISRVPGFYELFGDRGTTLSNPNLKPEHILRRDAGGVFRFGKAGSSFSGSIECAYFENDFTNLIQWYTTDAGFVTPENVGGSYVKGTEIVWSGSLINRFTCSGNWTFQESRVTKETRAYYRDKQLPDRPGNYGGFRVECLFGRFVPFWSIDRKSSYYLDRANQPHKRYPGRTLHDAGLSIPFKNGRYTCTVIVKNLTGVYTFDTQGMPKPGRSYMATFVVTL